MKIKSLLLAIFLMNTLFLSAQQNIFVDIEASAQFLQESTFEETTEFTFIREEAISDNTVLRSTFSQESVSVSTYNPELGLELVSNVNFNIAKNLHVRVGLGVNLMQFNITEDFNSLGSVLLSVDTITTTDPTGPLSGGSLCTSFTNSISDLGGIDGAKYYDIIALRIPFGISYDLFDTKFNIAAGGYIQTPIYNRFSTEFLTLHTEVDSSNPENSVCTYSRVVEENNVGEEIQSLSFGFNVSLAYQIEKNLDIQISLLKDVTNTFHDDFGSNSFFSAARNELFPTRVAVGLRYSFVSNKSEE